MAFDPVTYDLTSDLPCALMITELVVSDLARFDFVAFDPVTYDLTSDLVASDLVASDMVALPLI